MKYEIHSFWSTPEGEPFDIKAVVLTEHFRLLEHLNVLLADKECVSFTVRKLEEQVFKFKKSKTKPCRACKSTGFSDKINRGIWAMQPIGLICKICSGRGWIKK